MRKITTLDQLLVWLLTAMRTMDYSILASKDSSTAFEMIVQTVMEGCECPKCGGLEHKHGLEVHRAQAKFVRKAMKLEAPTPGESIRTVQLVCIAMDCLRFGGDFWLRTTKNGSYIRTVKGAGSHYATKTKVPISMDDIDILIKIKPIGFTIPLIHDYK